MEELLEILEDICPDVDFEAEEKLIDDKVIGSFEILSIISEISDAFNVTLTPAEIIPDNFNSAKALWKMIQTLQSR